jgi:hypothetical protein
MSIPVNSLFWREKKDLFFQIIIMKCGLQSNSPLNLRSLLSLQPILMRLWKNSEILMKIWLSFKLISKIVSSIYMIQGCNNQNLLTEL